MRNKIHFSIIPSIWGSIFLASLLSLRYALKRADAISVEQGAHALKGACANIGALALREVSSQVEKAGRDGDLNTAMEIFPKIEEGFKDFRRNLDWEVSSN